MSDLSGLLYRDFRLYVRQPFSVALALVSPLLYFFFFGLNMARSGLVAPDHYLLFFYPGYVTMSLFTSVNTLIQGMFNERLGGMITELLSCPVRITAYVISKLVFAMVVATVQSLILLGAVLWALPASAWHGILLKLALLIPVLLLASLVLAGMTACIIAMTVQIRTFTTVMSIVNPVLLFASTIFYPVSDQYVLLQTLTRINPLTWTSEAIRGVLSYRFDPMPFMLLFAAAVVLVAVAIRLHRWRSRTT